MKKFNKIIAGLLLALVLSTAAGCTGDTVNDTTDGTDNVDTDTNDSDADTDNDDGVLEDAGEDVIDGVEDIGDDVKDGAEDAVDDVKDTENEATN